MIMLPWPDQDVNGCHWAGSASNTGYARGDVWSKSGFVFAKFLLLF